MIDVHCHLNFYKFADDYDAVIQQALSDGVQKIINVGTKIDSSKEAVQLAEKYENLYAIVGVHPHHADKPSMPSHPELVSGSQNESGKMLKQVQHDELSWLDQLEQLARHPKTLGIGEIGMDYFSYQSNGIVDPKLQKETFERQIELAHKTGLPLQIHQRQAADDLMEILMYHKNSLQTVPGMFHCFAGSMEFLKKALDLGFYIGFDGNITYDGLAPGETTDLKDLARYIPIDRMVVETDSPYLTPVPHRGKRNTPSYVIITGQYIAELKGISFEQLEKQTTKNVHTIFPKLSLP